MTLNAKVAVKLSCATILLNISFINLTRQMKINYTPLLVSKSNNDNGIEIGEIIFQQILLEDIYTRCAVHHYLMWSEYYRRYITILVFIFLFLWLYHLKSH